MLEDGDHSAVLWCGFVCVLGFCVSMLFIVNGTLVIVIAARIAEELMVYIVRFGDLGTYRIMSV